MARSRRAAPARRAAPVRTAAPSAPARRAAPAPASSQSHHPAPTQAAPPPAQASSGGGGMLAGVGSTIVQGMAFGTGSAIAHRAVGAVAGAFSGGSDDHPQPVEAQQTQAPQPVPQQQQVNACFNDQKNFLDCLAQNNNDIAACQFYYDSFNQCKTQAQAGYV